MKAYNLAMGMIFFNAGLYLISTFNIFGNMGGISGNVFPILDKLNTPLITVLGISITGMTAIAVALAAGTIVFLNSNLVNDRGIAYVMFGIIFWGSYILAVKCLDSMSFAGTGAFVLIYTLSAAAIFIIAYIQMPTGGMQSHV